MCPFCRAAVLKELEQIRQEQSAAVGHELQLQISPEAERQLDAMPCSRQPGCDALKFPRRLH